MHSRFVHAVEIIGARGRGDDRASVFERDDGLVIALADGAGGTANGAKAAQAVIDAAGASVDRTSDWGSLLSVLDRDVGRLAHGQTTAVVLTVGPDGIVGASVGDSGAWLISAGDAIDLTDGQTRKPLVGAGCHPFRVEAESLGIQTLLVASDGLLRYAKRDAIVRIANGEDLPEAARALVDLVKLPTGGLQDDVSIVLCRQLR